MKRKSKLVILLNTILYLFTMVLFGNAEEIGLHESLCDNGTYKYIEYEDHICIVAYDGDDSNLVIPMELEGKAVTELGDGREGGFLTLHSVQIPETVTKMGAFVFKNCEHLKMVSLSPNIKEIPEGAFENCSNLTRITLPDEVEMVGNNAFCGSGLKELTLPACEEIVVFEKTFYNLGEPVCIRMPMEVKNIRFVDDETGENLRVRSFLLNSGDNVKDEVTVSGVEGSYAQTFASEWGLAFIKITSKNKGEEAFSESLTNKKEDTTEVHVTKEMVQDCMEIGAELQMYVDANSLEERDVDSCLEAVCQWLLRDSRVLSAEINQQCVLYSSVDHVAGIYEFPPKEGYFGSGDEITEDPTVSSEFQYCGEIADAYTTYLETGLLRSPDNPEEGIVYFDGQNSITNEKFLLLSTETDDAVTALREEMTPMLHQYEEELGYETRIVTGIQERGEILLSEPSLDQYGIVVWAGHGGKFRKADGSYLAFGNIGIPADRIIEIMYEADTTIQPEDANYDLFYVERDQLDYEHTVLYVSGHRTVLTSNYFPHFYQNRFFDNTIFFFGACSFGWDKSLIQFLLSHGVKGVFSFASSASEPLITNSYEEFFGSLLEKEKKNRKPMGKVDGGSALLYVSSVLNHWVDWSKQMVKQQGKVTAEDVGDSFPLICVNSEDFSLEHYGTLSGKVKLFTRNVTISENGAEKITTQLKDCPAADLYFYRFVNQAFDPGDTMRVSVNKDGTFEAEDLRWGVYAVQLTGEKIMDKVVGTVFADDRFDGGRILVSEWGTSVNAKVAVESEGIKENIPQAKVTLTLESTVLENEKEWVGTTYTYVTDENGSFSTDRLPAGSYQMEIIAEEGSYKGEYHWENSTDYVYNEPILLSELNYYEFIRDELIPQYGYASLENTTCYLTRNSRQELIGWDIRSGLIGADVADLNMDGIEDLLVYVLEEYEENNKSYTKFFLMLYTMEENEIIKVKELIMPLPLLDDGLDRFSAGIMNLNGRNYFYVERQRRGYFDNTDRAYYIWVEYRDNGCFMDRYKVEKSSEGSTDEAYSLVEWDETGTWEDAGYTSQLIWEETPGSSNGEALIKGSIGQPGLYDTIIGRGFQEIPGLSLDYIPGGKEYPTYWGSPTLKKSFQYHSHGEYDSDGVSISVSLQDETRLREKIEAISW